MTDHRAGAVIRCDRPSCQPRCSADMVWRISAGVGPLAGAAPRRRRARARGSPANRRVVAELRGQAGLPDPPWQPVHVAVRARAVWRPPRIAVGGDRRKRSGLT